MNANEILRQVMNLAVSINNKNEAGCLESINNLKDIELSFEQKRSILTYEESLIGKATEDETLVSFLESEIFNNQTIFDAKYVATIAKISNQNATVELLNDYLLSNIEFSEPLKQYRYCFVLSNKAITLGDISLMEQTIAKIDQFNSTHTSFTPTNYSFGV